MAKIVAGKSISCRSVEISHGKTYEELLGDLGINPETVVVLSSRGPVPFDELVEPGDVTIVRAVSSG